MNGRVKRAILSGGMLICLIGAAYSYSIDYDLGVYFNAAILFLLLGIWVILFKDERA